MQHIKALDLAAAPADAQDMLAAVQKKLGMLPNLHKTIAHSPAALQAYVRQTEALNSGVLTPALREQIALVTAGTNDCDYCASAHTLLGKYAGVSGDEAAANLRGRASDPRTQVALAFAKQIVADRGRSSAAHLRSVRGVGYSDAEIVEIVAHVALNLFTNYFNHIAATEIDFPLVRAGI
jgi:uncharacterized peroxidase-related enzyme